MVLSDDVRARVTSYIQHQGTKSADGLAALVGTSQQRFIELAAAVPEDISAKQPAEGEWSMRELIRHVIGAEALVAALVHDLARGVEKSRDGGLGMTIADDRRPYAGFVEQLRATNAAMLEAINGLPENPNLELKSRHPFFGPLNCREWAAFQRVHDEDHVQHGTKIVAAVSGG
jgi:hypothetical protein